MLFVAIPLLMLLAFIPCKSMKAIRTVAVTRASLLLALSFATLYLFIAERNAGNTAEMLFTADVMWYQALNVEIIALHCFNSISILSLFFSLISRSHDDFSPLQEAINHS